MKERCIEISAGIAALAVITALTVKLVNLPTSMLPPVYLALMLILVLLTVVLVATGILALLFKKLNVPVLYCVLLSLSGLLMLYKLCSPALSITVPRNYTGAVNLVLSNVSEDQLILDSNGIGYITKRAFDRTYTKPVVKDSDGKDLSGRCVGFSPSVFWGRARFSAPGSADIHTLSFELLPAGIAAEKQYYSTDLARYVDRKKLYTGD